MVTLHRLVHAYVLSPVATRSKPLHGCQARAHHDGEGAHAAVAAALGSPHPPQQHNPANHGNGNGHARYNTYDAVQPIVTNSTVRLLWSSKPQISCAKGKAFSPAVSDSFRIITVNGTPTTNDQANMRSVSCSCHAGSSFQPSPVCKRVTLSESALVKETRLHACRPAEVGLGFAAWLFLASTAGLPWDTSQHCKAGPNQHLHLELATVWVFEHKMASMLEGQ